MASERTTAGADAPLIVDLIGANQRLRDTLAMVFRGPAHGRCALATGTEAQAVVVNLDGVGADAEWARYRERHPGRPAIVLALDAAPVEHAIAVVAKPVRIDRFIAAIDAVQARLGEVVPVARAAHSRQDAPAIAKVEAGPVAVSTPIPAPVRAPTVTSPRPGPSIDGDDAPTEVRDADGRRRSPARDRWHRVCGSEPDCDLDDPVAAARRRFTGSARLLACVSSAVDASREQATPVHVRLRGQPVIAIDAGRGVAISALSDDQLAVLCGTDLDEHHIDAVPAPEVIEGATCAIDAMRWKLALWTHRGDLPQDAPLDVRVYLSRWPNLTRLVATPGATRIAALLVRHPMQLARVAEALAIPQRHVFAFFAAASAAGLTGVARRETDHLMAQMPPEPHSRRSLLGRIARRLPHEARSPEDAR